MSRDKHIEIALQDAERYARPHMDQGKVATYIPELAKGDPTKLGICIRTPDGEEYCQGDCQTEFSIQSISKTITLILALQTAGYDRVFSKVGMEPTGDAFNSMIRLETLTTHPMNPMINAGAIVVASCCVGAGKTFDDFLHLLHQGLRRPLRGVSQPGAHAVRAGDHPPEQGGVYLGVSGWGAQPGHGLFYAERKPAGMGRRGRGGAVF